jgi:predicted glycosyltransferase involved in capsule biosynthesis
MVINKVGTGLYNIGYSNANYKGQRGNQLKIKQGLAAYTAYLFHIAHAGNTQHYGKENNRRYQHRYQADKDLADHLRGGRKSFKIQADHHAQYNGNDDLEG